MKQDIYRQHILVLRDKMLNLALKYLGERDDAEDVVQEVLLKLWHTKEQLKSVDNPEAYAMTMTKNRCLDMLKNNKKFQDAEIPNVISQADTPSEATENREAVAIIGKIIETLPDLQRMIITMKDVEDYDMKEIADITGTSVEAVRMNLSRARKKIKEIYLTYLNYEKR